MGNSTTPGTNLPALSNDFESSDSREANEIPLFDQIEGRREESEHDIEDPEDEGVQNCPIRGCSPKSFAKAFLHVVWLLMTVLGPLVCLIYGIARGKSTDCPCESSNSFFRTFHYAHGWTMHWTHGILILPGVVSTSPFPPVVLVGWMFLCLLVRGGGTIMNLVVEYFQYQKNQETYVWFWGIWGCVDFFYWAFLATMTIVSWMRPGFVRAKLTDEFVLLMLLATCGAICKVIVLSPVEAELSPIIMNLIWLLILVKLVGKKNHLRMPVFVCFGVVEFFGLVIYYRNVGMNECREHQVVTQVAGVLTSAALDITVV